MVPARWHDDRHIHRLGIGGWFDQAAALGFELGSLCSFKRLLVECTQAGVGVAVSAGDWMAR